MRNSFLRDRFLRTFNSNVVYKMTCPVLACSCDAEDRSLRRAGQ